MLAVRKTRTVGRTRVDWKEPTLSPEGATFISPARERWVRSFKKNESRRDGTCNLPKILIALPELRPGHLGAAAHKNVRMILALFVLNPQRIAVMPGQPASGVTLVGAFARCAKHNQSRWRRVRISAIPS
jgi:hypothetical protein